MTSPPLSRRGVALRIGVPRHEKDIQKCGAGELREHLLAVLAQGEDRRRQASSKALLLIPIMLCEAKCYYPNLETDEFDSHHIAAPDFPLPEDDMHEARSQYNRSIFLGARSRAKSCTCTAGFFDWRRDQAMDVNETTHSWRDRCTRCTMPVRRRSDALRTSGCSDCRTWKPRGFCG